MVLKIGDKAPEFELADTSNKMVKLSDFKGEKIVLAFFPGAFTGVCTKEMCTFRDSMAAFNDLNAKVIGISVDTPFSLKKFQDENKLAFTLLSDHSKDTIRKYDIVHSKFIGIPNLDVSKRSVFILDRTGKIAYVWVSEDPGKEPNYDEIKKKLKEMN
ncbi:MAG: peroxiredoxin [Candidatus Thermoplasmatota archaeon]|jgi:peroxiredoxin|nr:peroxiredoxin [Candidatus Thermoplasmatota archaeon]MCL5790867.1 peroxiredoxin [Candidatus Thermoplasmatota archaeon]